MPREIPPRFTARRPVASYKSNVSRSCLLAEREKVRGSRNDLYEEVWCRVFVLEAAAAVSVLNVERALSANKIRATRHAVRYVIERLDGILLERNLRFRGSNGETLWTRKRDPEVFRIDALLDEERSLVVIGSIFSALERRGLLVHADDGYRPKAVAS